MTLKMYFSKMLKVSLIKLKLVLDHNVDNPNLKFQLNPSIHLEAINVFVKPLLIVLYHFHMFNDLCFNLFFITSFILNFHYLLRIQIRTYLVTWKTFHFIQIFCFALTVYHFSFFIELPMPMVLLYKAKV